MVEPKLDLIFDFSSRNKNEFCLGLIDSLVRAPKQIYGYITLRIKLSPVEILRKALLSL